MSWTLYLLRSERSGNTYAGIALDVERRVAQHNGELPGGAKATRGGRPWSLAASWGPFGDRGSAQKAEADLKRLSGVARLDWEPPPLDDEGD